MLKKLILFVLCLILLPTVSHSSPIVIKFSHVVATETPKGQAANYFKKLAEERTKGRVKIEVYPNSQLYKDKEEMEALQLGAVQMLVPSLAKFAPLGVKEFEVFDLPFIFDNYQELHNVTQGPVGAKLLKKLEPKGILGLAYWDNGFKVMSANKPLKAVDDFKGLKMRIQSSKVLDSEMRSVGAIPQIIAFSEVYQALQTGVVNGTENPPSNLYTQKMHEVQKYVTLSNHGYLGYAVIVNKKFWESLPADIRTILEGAMKDATKFANDVAKKDNDVALAAVKKSGRSQLITLSPQEREAWKKAMDKTHKDNMSRISYDIVKDVYMATSYESPFKDKNSYYVQNDNDLNSRETTYSTQVKTDPEPVAPSDPPSLSATLSFSEPSGNNILDADETGKLVITIKNSGRGDANNVIANLSLSKQVNGLSYDRNVNIGTISAGKTIKKEIDLSASEEILTEKLTFNVEINEQNGFGPDPMKISFSTKELIPPQLLVADIGINDESGGSKIEPGKVVEATVRVQNIGQGNARNVSAIVHKGKNVFIAGDSKTNFDLGAIPSGKFVDFKFSFFASKNIKNGETVPLSVELSEARPRFNSNKQLALVMNSSQKSAQEFVVMATEQEQKTNIQLAGGLSVDVDANIPEGQKAGEYDIAVVIGNKYYAQSGSPDVDFAVHDAQIMKEYLMRTMGFQPENIIYEENAGISKFNEIFGTERNYKGKLFKHVKAGESRVFVYYVGHGAPDLETQDAYLVPVDANPQYLSSNGYRLQTFYDNLAKIPATRMTVILDSCFSGNSEKGMLFKGMSPALVKVKKELRGPDKATVITSAGTDQISVWYPEKRHSLFTYFFLKGISGDADYNKDSKIDVGEMKRYLADKVPYMANRLKGYDQQPVVSGDSADVLAVLKK